MSKKKGGSPAKERHVQRKEVVRDLKCELSQDEKMETAEVLADALRELQTIETERADVMETFKARKKSADTIIGNCSDLLRTGSEKRAVKCEIENDYDKGTVTVFRTDTNRVVDGPRAMTEVEAQMGLPIEEPQEEPPAEPEAEPAAAD